MSAQPKLKLKFLGAKEIHSSDGFSLEMPNAPVPKTKAHYKAFWHMVFDTVYLKPWCPICELPLILDKFNANVSALPIPHTLGQNPPPNTLQVPTQTDITLKFVCPKCKTEVEGISDQFTSDDRGNFWVNKFYVTSIKWNVDGS